MPETTPLIKAALNLRAGAGFDVYGFDVYFPICIMRLDYYGVTTLEYFALTLFHDIIYLQQMPQIPLRHSLSTY